MQINKQKAISVLMLTIMLVIAINYFTGLSTQNNIQLKQNLKLK